MRNNILPKDFASKLMPTDDAGKLVISDNTLNSYIEAVLQYLQNLNQSLNTVDFVDAVVQSLDLDLDNITVSSDLTAALRNTLTCKHYQMSGTDEILYYDIKDWLTAQEGDYITYNRHRAILAADFPMVSTLNPRKIAVWRNTSKMGNWDKRQAVSVRKWIKSTFTDFTESQVESLAKLIDEKLVSLIELDIRHHSSYEFDAWERAYCSEKIKSCMHPDSSCEVGRERTFTCYCSGYHGLPDNGLNLTVLYQDDTPVARAITYTEDEQKYYIRAYGDDRLKTWLLANGYEQRSFAEGTILYTTADLLKPYVDGDIYYSDHYTTNDGKHYWVLSSEGEHDLQTTNAYASNMTMCECCGESYPEADTYEFDSVVNGWLYTVCEGCADNNRYYVYTGGLYADLLFFHDGHSPDTNPEYVDYNEEYYAVDSLSEYGLRLIDGKVYHEDDLYYCDLSEEWFLDSDDVYTDTEQISTTQPVHFPYICVSREYWDDNVVETTCGTLALSDDTRRISTPPLGSVITLDDYWTAYIRRDARGEQHIGIIFELDEIERDYEYEPSDKMQAFRDYAIAYNKIQYLRFQELGI